MKKLLLFSALLLFINHSGFGQGIIAYEDAYYQGKSMTITKDMSWVGNDWNDKISSIRIPQGYKIQVYEDANYAGPSKILESDWTVTNSSLQWNDKISSIRIIATPPPLPQGITVYEHANYMGRSKVITNDMSWVGNDWNDMISSIRIPQGYTIQVYEDADYKGQVMKLYNDWTVSNSNLEWNDKISSIKIISTPGPGQRPTMGRPGTNPQEGIPRQTNHR